MGRDLHLFFPVPDKFFLSLCHMPDAAGCTSRDEHNGSDSCPHGADSLSGETEVKQTKSLELG